MAKKLVDMRDARFVVFEQLEAEKHLLPELREDYDLETLGMVLTEAEKLAASVLAPTNKDGDRVGCRYEGGRVTVPPSFHKAYGLMAEGGWNIISDPLEAGGQGLPKLIEICCRELFQAANTGFSNFVNLTHGAGKLIEIFGSEEQKDLYLGKLYSGQWCGTMCLTEPDAGSDVGAVKTGARRNPDGTYSIKGTKIFITGGEHDMVENIVHMVLARIEGDPEGTKGLSLFIVPKRRVDGEDNDVVCTGIEEKMGLHGSCTCTLNFGDEDRCLGYLIGGERQGIMVMFHMMNEARQLVGSQGLAVGSAAYLEALAYARERVQGVHFSEARDPDARKVAIIHHPDVRATLMRMKAYVEGCRALVYYHAHLMDRAQLAESDEDRSRFQGLVELLTPVCKAYSSDKGFEVCNAAVQVLAGYGYSSEFPVEQYLRDVKITSIYEGTNGIQAIDLVTRKIGMKKGQVFQSLMGLFDTVASLAEKVQGLGRQTELLREYRSMLEDGTRHILGEVKSAAAASGLSKATKYLEFFGDVTLACLWLWQAAVAQGRLQTLLEQRGLGPNDLDLREPPDQEMAFYAGKVRTGRHYLDRIMPAVSGKLAEIKSAGDDIMGLSDACL